MVVNLSRMYIQVTVVIVLLIFGACALAEDESTTGEMDHSGMVMIVPGEVTVETAMSNASPPGAANGAAYLTITNGLDASIRLVSIEGDVAGKLELHETVKENDVLKMVPQHDGFEILAGEQLRLEPGGKHIMMMGLVQPLVADDEFELTLNFDGADSQTITVQVLEIGETMDHGRHSQ
ncbi:copper chaperone PCu(A)C [Chloroflexi bacterium TSY]|nr:copper chaperone PCu(A)C [Chloroflexi bacterium TSY]